MRIDGPQVTSSLSLNGTTITDLNVFVTTGSLNGITGSYATTGSLNSFTSSANSRLNSIEGVSGSYATTGSNLFKGSQTISGSVIPAVDNTYDLGSITHQFRDLYLSSASLYIDGTKVLGSTAQELQITTDTGQSFKILESSSDTITLQSADGNITLATSGGGDVIMDPTNGVIGLKGTVTVYTGNKITSSDGNSIQFGNGIAVTGSIVSTVTPLVSGSSQVLNGSGVWSGSAQLPSGIVSSSLQVTGYGFATTGSNTFVGTQVISGSILQSGSFTTTGTIIAQTINVQNVTSSVVYSSGSNVFGNDIGNSQVFTGSVLITGSLTISGASSASSYSGTTIYGSTAVCSAVGYFSGCVGIGKIPSFPLDVCGFAGDTITAKFARGGGECNFYVSATNNQYINLATEGSLRFKVGVTTNCPYSSGTSAMVITSAGNVLLNNTFGGAQMVIADSAKSGNGTPFTLSSTDASNQMQLVFTRVASSYFSIQSVEQTIGYRDLILQTTGGNVGIATTTPSTKLDVYAGADATSNLVLWGQTIRNEGNGAATGYGAGLKLKISTDNVTNEIYKWAGIAAVAGTNYSNRTDLVLFANAGATSNAIEKVRITGDGYVGINTCTPSNLLHIEASNNTTNQFRLNSCDGLNAGLRSYTTSDGSGLIINHYYAASGSPYLRTSDFVSNQGDGASTQMRFFTKDLNANAALAMIITSGGKVGIGTTLPGLNLSAQGLYGLPNTSGTQTVGIFRVQDCASNIALDMGVVQNVATWIQSGNKANSEVLPLTLNPSGGNVGIGVTPSVWRSSERALQIGPTTTLYDVFGITILGNNFYTNTSSQSIYSTCGYASYYWQNTSDGSHVWTTAPSAAAGSVISFCERMRITCGGTIGIGTTTPKTYSSLTTQGQLISLNNIGIDYGQSFRLNNYYNSGTGTDRTISSGYAASIGLNQTSGAISFQMSTTCAAADNNVTTTSRMHISNCGHIVVNNAPNGQADYGRFTISTSTPKTSDPSTQEKTVLHLSTCETDTPFGLKFQIIGGSCDCTRAVAMQTGDHYISNQGNIVMQVAGGRVGIGIDNPEYKLHVCSPQSLLKLSSSTATFGSPGINLLQGAIDTVITATNTGLEVGTWSNHPIIFRTIQQERVRISNGGLTVCGTIVNSATAGSTNYTLDTMTAYQSIANGGFVDFDAMSGMILVNNWLNGGVTIYLVGGGGTVALGSVVATVGTMHHSAGVGGYRWCNNYGSTANFGFQVFRTRNTA